MITTGTELYDFLTLLNGGASLDPTLADILVDNARAIIEEERPWVVLRKTDTSISVTTANTWDTAIDLSTITDFSRFYDEENAIILFDGDNRKEHYILVPFDRRLEYKDVSNTAVYDENSKKLYLNGTVAYNGTLYISYISSSASGIDLTSGSAVWTEFPPRFLPVLGYYAIGIYKGAVDYDSINKLMLPENRATLRALKDALYEWDDNKQQNSLYLNDPSDSGDGFRSGAINRY